MSSVLQEGVFCDRHSMGRRVSLSEASSDVRHTYESRGQVLRTRVGCRVYVAHISKERHLPVDISPEDWRADCHKRAEILAFGVHQLVDDRFVHLLGTGAPHHVRMSSEFA